MSIKAPFLPYEKLREVADQFLARHHPSRAVPVPIEQIIEFDFGMNIIPLPGLHEAVEVDSAISNDLLTIFVDEFVYKRRETRYRFSLAHELSHRLLHQDIFAQLKFATVGEWQQALRSIPSDEYGWIEWQAYSLAGLILVPGDRLDEAYTRADELAARRGVSLQDMDRDARQVVCSSIGREFNVSAGVIQKRLAKQGIWTR